MADHNDPNAVNHIFSDIDYSPADLYDLFGWPINDGTKVVLALTFASAPSAGVMDSDLLDFRFHRLVDVRCDLQMCPLLAGRVEGPVLLAHLDFQEGRYEAARVGCEQLLEENRSWDNLARLAHWKSKLGEITEAYELYEEAEDNLTAKQMRSYAWLELQRGVLAITHGDYAKA